MQFKNALAWVVVGAMAATAVGADVPKTEQRGKLELKSAGPLAFGPKGVVFIGDPKGAAIYAVETNEAAETSSHSRPSVNVDGVNQKIAALLGTKADEIRIQGVAVSPASGKVYISVSRGRGPDALPVIVRVDATSKIDEFPLDNVTFSKANIPNPPEDKETGSGRRKRNNRNDAITDLAYIDGTVVIAGLSNEDFASNLRAIPYPFSEVNRGTSIEIFHGSHGRLETRSPIRTFVPIAFGGDPQIIAAYTCTPLVRIPLSELKPGVKVRGTTVAELGNMNQPLKIIAYQKDGKNFLLLANAARGVMKISTEGLLTREGITAPVRGTAGQPYEAIKEWKGVKQLGQLDDANAVVLIEQGGKSDLRTLPLP